MQTKKANNKIAGIIHAYPGDYLLDSLHQAGWQIALLCPQELSGTSILQHRAIIDVRLCDFNRQDTVLAAAVASFEANRWDIVLPINEGCVNLTAMVAQQLGLAGNSLFAANASRDKSQSYRQFEAFDISHPKSTVIHSREQADALAEQLTFPGILKLTDSMNSQGVIRVNDTAQFDEGISHLFSLFDENRRADFALDRNIYAYGKTEGKVLFQPFCADEEIGIDLLYRHGETTVLGIFEKCPSSGPYFAEMYSVFPTSLNQQQLSEAVELAKKAVFALDVALGAAHVEIRFNQGKPYVLEIGLRPGGGYTAIACEQMSGINTYAALADILMGGALPQPDFSQCSAMLYGGILYPQSGVLQQVNGMDNFSSRPGLVDLVTLGKIGDKVMTMPHSAQPHYAYYLFKGESREALLAVYRDIEATVTIDIEQDSI
ncbi:MAG: ATP-grasp domain-containing protein [Psychrosphaera sp.]|nr:ATP-grasp domain-containing protein [Psychrosphaera sp.]